MLRMNTCAVASHPVPVLQLILVIPACIAAITSEGIKVILYKRTEMH
jgi:hypothetical protein